MEQKVQKIKAEPVKLGSKGYYSLSVYKADGTEVEEKRVDACNNVVTYGGAYSIFFGTAMFSNYYANIGTGASEITRSSTGLGNRFNATSSGSSASRAGNEVDNGDGTSTLTFVRTMSFSLGSTTGTFSEVGISTSSNGSGFIAGQLIKDALGNPTTITVLSDEQLRVTYTLELTIPNGGLAVQPSIGTGTVTTPEGSSTYTIYTQPFFSVYTVGDSFATIRLSSARSVTSFNNSAGTTITSTSTGGISLSHDGTGTVTVTTGNNTLAPSSFSSTDIAYIGAGGGSNSSAAVNNLNITSKRYPSTSSSYQYLAAEFSPPLSKDATRSLRCQFELVYTI